MATEQDVLSHLATVKYPGFSRDIVSFGLVKGVQCDGPLLTVRLAVTTADRSAIETLRAACEAALAPLPGVDNVQIIIDQRVPQQPTASAPAASRLPGVQRVIAVASGKGGVGKSTVAANLAAAFAQSGLRTGLCDCDLYGPSMGLMFGVDERPRATEDERIIPIERDGIRLMSMSFLTDPATPAILRGPRVTQFTQQFLRGVVWGDLDMLILDLPPGTGDIQLTIVQTVELTGAVIVTTPQEVALIDARKAVAMFEKVNVPVLGLVENMSYFVCPNDNTKYHIFGEGGGRREAKRLGVPLLAEIPLDIPTRESGDRGRPIVLTDPQSHVAQAFTRAVAAMAA